MFEEGDNVVYPHHGAGVVLKKESKSLMGEKRDYLTIQILHNDMTVMVPCENAGVAGLRRVINEVEVKKVINVLTDDVSEMPKNWNRRFKYNREKIKTGDVFELAEVVRNLAIREWEKGLSTGEKQMYTRAKKILASEFMYALDKDEERAEEYLDELLEAELRHQGQRLSLRSGSRVTPETEATAVIAAAGSGERLGAGGPKALVEVGGRPLVAWSLAALAEAETVANAVVAAPADRIERFEEALGGDASPIPVEVVAGGESRSESVAGALGGIEADFVVVCDAARPLVTAALIDAVVTRLAGDGEPACVLAAAPITDTVKEVDGEVVDAHARPLLALGRPDPAGVSHAVPARGDRVGRFAVGRDRRRDARRAHGRPRPDAPGTGREHQGDDADSTCGSRSCFSRSGAAARSRARARRGGCGRAEGPPPRATRRRGGADGGGRRGGAARTGCRSRRAGSRRG